MTSHSRRTFLRTAGRAAAVAPFVPLLEREVEAAGAVPRRLVLIQNGSGVRSPEWTFENSMAPLAPWRAQAIAFAGLDIKQKSFLSGQPHPCCPVVVTNMADPRNNGQSLDQIVAAKIGGTRFPSLHLGLLAATLVRSTFWRAGTYLPIETDAKAAFDRTFAGIGPGGAGAPGAASDAAAKQRLAVERRVLDHVSKDLQSFSRGLGAADKQRVDSYLTSLLEVSRSLEGLPVGGPASGCSRPALEPISDAADEEKVTKAFADIAVNALACDLTRVVSIVHSAAAASARLPQLGGPFLTLDHHRITHGDNGTPKSEAAKADKFWASRVAYLVGELAKRKDPDGSTMLDNTMVVWFNDFGSWVFGQHTQLGIPFVIVGGSWAWKATRGQFLRYTNESHGKLLTSIAHAFGVETEHVGDAQYGKGPLDRLA